MAIRYAAAAVLIVLAFAHASGAAANESLLLAAIKAGDQAAAQRLLTEPGAANAAEPDGTTALHWAVATDEESLVDLLLRAGADVKAANRYGVTPVSLAALNGSAPITQMLLDGGADPNARAAEGQTVLMVAARTGNAAVVSLLLAAGADVHARESVLGETALMWAALENHPAAVALLVEHGADVNARSEAMAFTRFKFGDGIVARPTVLPKGGWTPLMYAARQNALDAAAALADAGADLNLTDPDGTSALVFAIINGHYDVAELLLRKGADPDVADVTGMTALYAAVDMHTLDETVGRPNPRPHSTIDVPGLVRSLLAHGADPNSRLKSRVLERLHNDGDPNMGDGATPLMRAAKYADVTLMRLLLEHGADPNLRTADQRTALIYAASRLTGFRGSPNRGSERDAVAAIALCLEHGAGIDAADASGQTALHFAALQAEDSVVTFLVAQGASPHARDNRGRTPLDVAVGGGGRGGRRAVDEGRVTLLRQLTGAR